MRDPSGRIALVTGGSSGIGAATTRLLAARGTRVATLDLSGSAGESALSIVGDVADSADVEASVVRVERELGPIDILVCAAGVPGASLPTVDVTDEEWKRTTAINADGVFYCNRAVLPGMIARGYGRIVNVASIAGKEGNPMAAAYSASKAAVIALIKAIGKDVARNPNGTDGIGRRGCCSSPGLRATSAPSPPARPTTSRAVEPSTDGAPDQADREPAECRGLLRQRLSKLRVGRNAAAAASSKVLSPRASSSLVGQAKPRRKKRRSWSNQWPPPTYVPWSSNSTR
jgi:NAD(P)-dependent dehydrogenase (short-subunit alcohol dehydrogenase family)